MRLPTNTKILLPKGRYFLANECSSYEFTNDGGVIEQKVVLSKLSISFANRSSNVQFLNQNGNTYNSLCYDPIDGKEHWFANKSNFDILPGKNTISISGRNIALNLQPNVFRIKK